MQLDGKYRSSGASVALEVNDNKDLHVVAPAGKYTEAALAGRLFYCANQSPINTGTTLSTAFVGLGLCNPTGSGKNIIVHEFSYALDQACAAAMILALATTTDSGFAAELTPKCTMNGVGTSVAIVDTTATVAAPVIVKVIGAVGNAATTTFPNLPAIVNLEGQIILPPGRSLVTDTTAAMGATSVQFSYLWEEVDI